MKEILGWNFAAGGSMILPLTYTPTSIVVNEVMIYASNIALDKQTSLLRAD